FSKSVGVVVGILALIIVGTVVITRLTDVRTSSSSRASEPLCTGLLINECVGSCIWQNNTCISLVSSVAAPTIQQLEVCPKGLDCSADYTLEFDWDTAGYGSCRNVDAFGIETKMRCCPPGLIRIKTDGKEPGVCDCPNGKQKGAFTSAEDVGKCIDYKPISKKDGDINNRCLSGLSCILGTTEETSPRGSGFCFDGSGEGQYCCQPGDTVTIPTDSTLKSFCKKNSWYSMW
ncbi:MAG: hypothetical protein NTV98_04250, partial [Candidatus Roizmanbacteria bacterium]|nr:hypothetical protein [Candidatus Roizmanbacteria bacterium]